MGATRPDGPDGRLEAALAHHQTGRLAEAETLYRQVLEAEPENAGALHFLGVLGLQAGNAESAADLIARAIALRPGEAMFHSNLGNAQQTQGDLDAAAASFRRATELKPDFADAHSNLGNTLRRLGRNEEAAAACARAVELKPDFLDAHYNLGLALMDLGRPEDAIGPMREVMRLDPAHVQAHYLVKALAGEPCDSVPREFVAELFDTHADNFDLVLVDNLDYAVPGGLRDLMGAFADNGPPGWTVYDLGCGTGLCGPLFRDLAGQLYGGDLSARMIDKARARGLYDQLWVEDLLETLARAPGDADLLLAADVFIYVGELEELFPAAAKALRPGGLFGFSTEQESGDRFTLQTNGRFSHGESYVRGMAAANGFKIERAEPFDLRSEHGKPVGGRLFVLRQAGP